MRRATNVRPDTRRPCAISIHALLAESDAAVDAVGKHTGRFLSTLSLRRATEQFEKGDAAMKISIHALLAESDPPLEPFFDCFSRFLSTLSLRRATCCGAGCASPVRYFYPRSPCGERLFPSGTAPLVRNFYPRSPCGERLAVDFLFGDAVLFLSTLSLRRATDGLTIDGGYLLISIHALLAESDRG